MRRILPLVLLLACLSPMRPAEAAPGEAASGSAPSIYLHRSAVLEGESFTLGEVATVMSSDPAQAHRLAGLSLGPAPRRPTLLPAAAVQDRVKAAAGASVIGGRVLLLPRSAVPPGQEGFYQTLLSFIDRQDTLQQGRIEIAMLQTPVVLQYSGGRQGGSGLASGWQERIVFETRSSASGYLSGPGQARALAGEMEIAYRVFDSGRDGTRGAQSISGSFRIWIHHYLEVARARVKLAVNQALSPELLFYSEEDVSLLRGPVLLRSDNPEQYRTAAPVAQGERLERLERNLTVRAGERITILFVRPGLQISVPGRAFRSGGPGDLIEVRPETGQKRFNGRITAKGEVVVESF